MSTNHVGREKSAANIVTFMKTIIALIRLDKIHLLAGGMWLLYALSRSSLSSTFYRILFVGSGLTLQNTVREYPVNCVGPPSICEISHSLQGR